MSWLRLYVWVDLGYMSCTAIVKHEVIEVVCVSWPGLYIVYCHGKTWGDWGWKLTWTHQCGDAFIKKYHCSLLEVNCFYTEIELLYINMSSHTLDTPHGIFPNYIWISTLLIPNGFAMGAPNRRELYMYFTFSDFLCIIEANGKLIFCLLLWIKCMDSSVGMK